MEKSTPKYFIQNQSKFCVVQRVPQIYLPKPDGSFERIKTVSKDLDHILIQFQKNLRKLKKNPSKCLTDTDLLRYAKKEEDHMAGREISHKKETQKWHRQQKQQKCKIKKLTNTLQMHEKIEESINLVGDDRKDAFLEQTHSRKIMVNQEKNTSAMSVRGSGWSHP